MFSDQNAIITYKELIIEAVQDETSLNNLIQELLRFNLSQEAKNFQVKHISSVPPS